MKIRILCKSLVKLLISIFAFTVILNLGQQLALASYSVNYTGNLGVFNVHDQDEGATNINNIVTPGMDSIVSITVRYRLSRGSEATVHIKPGKRYTNDDPAYMPSVVVTSEDWTSPVTYSISDGGYYSLTLTGSTEMNTSAVIAQVEVQNIKYRRYSLDGASLILGNDGFVHASCMNNSPNGNIRYNFKNNETGAEQWQSKETSWIDTSIGNGKSYSYTLSWGFYPNYTAGGTIDMGSIYIPIDPDLTDRVNNVISDVRNGYGNTITAVRDDTGTALSEARQASTNSQNANASAINAYNAVNNVNGNTITAVRDADGTVLSEARQAKTSAQDASANAQNAYNTAQTVNTKVDALANAITDIDTAIVGVNGDNSLIVSAVRGPGGTVLDVSQNAYGAVEDANGNTINAVRDSGGTVLDASRTARDASQEAVTKIDTLQTTVNNYMSADTTPPVITLGTVSGAMATSGSSIQAFIDVSDNLSTSFTYSFDGIDYSILPEDGTISLPVSAPGINRITVWVKDEAGNYSRKSISIRKLY